MLRLKIINNPKPLRLRTQVNFPNVILGKMQEKTVKPKTTFQEILPDKNYDGLSKVNVEAVTNDIDENIKSENIKKNVSILGVQGNIEELKGTKLEITKNGTYTPEEPYNAFTEVDVNVSADVSEYFGNTITAGNGNSSGLNNIIKKIPNNLTITGNNASYLFGGCKSLTEIPQLNISNVINTTRMFNGCESLTEIPQLDTSNVTDMTGMFAGCRKLESIPNMDTSKVTRMYSMFENCNSLKSIPNMDTSNVTTMGDMFNYCYLIKQIPNIDTSNNTAMNYMFNGCSKLETIPLLDASKVITVYDTFYQCYALTNLGGLQNLGQAFTTTSQANFYNYKLSLISCGKLTHDSLMNVGNNLYDIASKGVKTQQVVMGSPNIVKLTPEELLVFTNKGFSVS